MYFGEFNVNFKESLVKNVYLVFWRFHLLAHSLTHSLTRTYSLTHSQEFNQEQKQAVDQNTKMIQQREQEIIKIVEVSIASSLPVQ